MPEARPVTLKIEFQRVQTFLFKVPRLADMVGANALLGDLVRRRLPLALKPFLCPACDRDTSVTGIDGLAELEGQLKEEGDPLVADTDGSDGWLSFADRPSAHLARGLLVRDGGRVWACIDANKVKQAQGAAAATIQKTCPGLGYAFHLGDESGNRASNQTPAASATDVVALPCFAWAEDGGEEPASKRIPIGDARRRVAHSSIIKREARSQRAEFWDVASLLYTRKAIPCLRHGDSDSTDFQEIAGGRYLAVVHMDGNAIGQRAQSYQHGGGTGASRGHQLERFFLAMRSAMRRAVVNALNKQFTDCPDNYRLLMLGGDDVLIVCRADRALPLIRDVASDLLKWKLPDDEPLTLGAGVVIARPKLPFFRLHQLAEQLAASAKRVALDPQGQRRSVVDWLITTSSWMDSVDRQRARWHRVGYSDPENGSAETVLLTGRPYPVLPSEGEPSLAALLDLAQDLRKKFQYGVAGEVESDDGVRSQLRWFLGELHKGRVYSELVWNDLPEGLRDWLSKHPPAGLSAPGLSGEGLWVQLSDKPCHYRTWLPDLIELLELPVIGRESARADSTGPGEDAA